MKGRAIVMWMWLFSLSCSGFGIDGHEQFMANTCKCEDFPALVETIELKGGNVQGCAKKFGDSLKWGFIIDNDACDPFLPFVYDGAKNFDCGLAPVKKGKFWGAIDTAGRSIINFQYIELESFKDSLAAFRDSADHWGFISEKGDTVVKASFKYVSYFHAKLSLVETVNGNWNVINTKSEILPVKIDSLVRGYYEGENDLALSWAYMGNKQREFFDYPIYSDGRIVRLVAFNNSYALLSDTTDTRLILMGQNKISPSLLKPIFKIN